VIDVLCRAEKVDFRTQLLPESFLVKVLADYADTPCTHDQATAATADLLRTRRPAKVTDEFKIHCTQLYDTFRAATGFAAAAVVKAYPEKSGLPKPAVLANMLSAEDGHRALILANALCHVQERERRHAAMRAKAALEAEKGTPEERREAQQRMLDKAAAFRRHVEARVR
jgi:hypothetical protein